MNPPARIALIVGSNRRESLNRKLAQGIVQLSPPTLRFEDIRIDDLPMYNGDLEGARPDEVNRFTDAVRACQGVFIVMPEHNRSLPALLKNAIDWGSKPSDRNVWRDKPAAITGTSPGRHRHRRRPAAPAPDPRRARRHGARRRGVHRRPPRPVRRRRPVGRRVGQGLSECLRRAFCRPGRPPGGLRPRGRRSGRCAWRAGRASFGARAAPLKAFSVAAAPPGRRRVGRPSGLRRSAAGRHRSCASRRRPAAR